MSADIDEASIAPCLDKLRNTSVAPGIWMGQSHLLWSRTELIDCGVGRVAQDGGHEYDRIVRTVAQNDRGLFAKTPFEFAFGPVRSPSGDLFGCPTNA